MSKVGRRAIPLDGVKIDIKGNEIELQGAKGKFVHELPSCLSCSVEDNNKALVLSMKDGGRLKEKALWGLHRALLANKVKGLQSGFEKILRIVGLGYKAQMSGSTMTLTLGFSHKIQYVVPEGVTVAIDKSGQILTLSSIDKLILGEACDAIRSFKRPEPYKGTGIMYDKEVIHRKVGKAKGA